MHWTDEVASQITAATPRDATGAVVINDSKTPSGRAHVGALRGVLIHDAVFRTLRDRGEKVRYFFGVDDYDPVDELPHGMKEHFQQYLGQPLCNTPAPPGSTATDMADHFITEFFSVFAELGVRPEFYRMRDIYRTGRFNAAIDTILMNAETVRRIYKEVSNAERPAGWLPFQVICEKCGRIGTTECTNYTGNTVDYVCRPDLVEWAKGCGHRGTMSPFDGRGKLPWKLEWVAKWVTFPVAIEGAGEDHSTKGGSRDVASHCLKAIYGREAPINIPYGFLLLGGAKMSSSKGIGVAARDMADFLPPEVLRFLMIRPAPKRQANFEPTQEALVKLFNDLDRAHKKTFDDPAFPEFEKRSYLLSEAAEPSEGPFFDCDFGLVLALVQMPHLDVAREFERIKLEAGAGPLTEVERGHLARRIRAAQLWLANHATPEEKLVLQQTLPPSAAELSVVQRGFLHFLGDMLAIADGPGAVAWSGESLQSAVFDAARRTPIEQPLGFAALYRVLLDKAAGPKAGNFLAFLDRAWVVARLRALPLDRREFVESTAANSAEIAAWAAKQRGGFASARVVGEAPGIREIELVGNDGKAHLRRVKIAPGATSPSSTLEELGAALGLAVTAA